MFSLKKILRTGSGEYDLDEICSGMKQSNKKLVNRRYIVYLISTLGIHDQLQKHGYDKLLNNRRFTTIGAMNQVILIHHILYLDQCKFSDAVLNYNLAFESGTLIDQVVGMYFNFQQNLCDHFDSFKFPLLLIDHNQLLVEYSHIYMLGNLLKQLCKVYKMYDQMRIELPQFGKCLIKDFTVIYNYLSKAIANEQKCIPQMDPLKSRYMYKSYQMVIQLTPIIRNMYKLKICQKLKEPSYFVVDYEFNKQLELQMKDADLSMVFIQI